MLNLSLNSCSLDRKTKTSANKKLIIDFFFQKAFVPKQFSVCGTSFKSATIMNHYRKMSPSACGPSICTTLLQGSRKKVLILEDSPLTGGEGVRGCGNR